MKKKKNSQASQFYPVEAKSATFGHVRFRVPIALLQLVAIAGYSSSLRLAIDPLKRTLPKAQLRILEL